MKRTARSYMFKEVKKILKLMCSHNRVVFMVQYSLEVSLYDSLSGPAILLVYQQNQVRWSSKENHSTPVMFVDDQKLEYFAARFSEYVEY